MSRYSMYDICTRAAEVAWYSVVWSPVPLIDGVYVVIN